MKKSASQIAKEYFREFQHYYVRDRTHDENGRLAFRHLATVAIGVTYEGKICRGIAICSASQNFSKKEGIECAIGRMIAAHLHQKSELPIYSSGMRSVGGGRLTKSVESVDRFSLNADDIYQWKRSNSVFKSGYDVLPTNKEIKILSL